MELGKKIYSFFHLISLTNPVKIKCAYRSWSLKCLNRAGKKKKSYDLAHLSIKFFFANYKIS